LEAHVLHAEALRGGRAQNGGRRQPANLESHAVILTPPLRRTRRGVEQPTLYTSICGGLKTRGSGHRSAPSATARSIRLAAGEDTMQETKHALVTRLEGEARRIRRNVWRALRAGGGGHAGGSLSAADALAALYFHRMRVRSSEPEWPDRDRF